MSKLISFYSWKYIIIFRSKLSFFDLEKLLLTDFLNFKLLNLNKYFFFTFCNINNCFLLCMKNFSFSYFLKMIEHLNFNIIYIIINNRFYYVSNFVSTFILEKNDFLLKIIQHCNTVCFYLLYTIKKLLINFFTLLINFYNKLTNIKIL